MLRSRAILDLGSHLGTTALVFADYTDQVFTFELCQRNIDEMTELLRQNPVQSAKIVVVHAGVTFYTGNTCVAHCTGPGANINPLQGPCVVTPLVALDDYFATGNTSIGFIKADIEGSGFNMVKGALKTMRKHLPILTVSIYHNIEELIDLPLFLLSRIPSI
jgi:FkbM family methyltransferase